MAEGSVHTVYSDGRWKNRIEGAAPLPGWYDRQEIAAEAGRAYAIRRQAEHVIRNEDGTVAQRVAPATTRSAMMAKGLVDSVPADGQWRKQRRGDGAAVHRLSAGVRAEASDGVAPRDETFTRGAWVAAVLSAAVRGGRRVNAELVKEAEFGWYSQQFAQQWRNEGRRQQRMAALDCQRDYGPQPGFSPTTVAYLAVAVISALAGVLLVLVNGG